MRHGAGVALLERVLVRLDLAEQCIATGLRGDRRLGSKDRPWVADALYGIVRRHRLLTTLLTRGGWQGDDPAETLWWAWMVLAHGLPPAEAQATGPWLAGCADPAATLEDWGRDEPPWRWLATVGSLPDWLAQALIADRGEDQAWAEVAAQDRRAPVVLRVAAHRASRDDVLAELIAEGIAATPGRWSPHAIRIAGRVQLQALPCWRDGRVSLQDEASQVIAALVDPPRNGRVVDACAGAGGKALAIAAGAGGRVGIAALDIRGRSLAECERRARREQLPIQTHLIEAQGPLPLADGSADRVLVDAPCTGSGTLRRHPGLRWRWDGRSAAALPALQLQLLHRFSGLVAPGGRLIHATCSLWQAENQDVVDRFLHEAPVWRRVPLDNVLDGPLAQLASARGELSMSPATTDTDGFFAAVLERSPGV